MEIKLNSVKGLLCITGLVAYSHYFQLTFFSFSSAALTSSSSLAQMQAVA